MNPRDLIFAMGGLYPVQPPREEYSDSRFPFTYAYDFALVPATSEEGAGDGS